MENFFGQKTILVVDDEKSVRESLNKVLSKEGYRVLEAESGEEALSVCRKEFVNLVLTDLKMPEMDGLELLKALKLLQPDVAVIMMTAYGTIEKALESTGQKLLNIIGTSPAMRKVLTLVEQIAPSSATVLILGESGTGKGVIAETIHRASDRKEKPFVTLSCAAIPETLLEAELFGYEKGAFTGAAARKLGRFEVADGGTLFLDEVGEIPPAIQV